MPKRRRRELQNDTPSVPLSPQRPTKRRKTHIRHPPHTLSVSSTDDSLCSNTYQYDDTDSNHKPRPDVDDNACFHFDQFRSLDGPYPCLYRTCNGLEFERWRDWKEHWIDQHRQYYLDCDQIIPMAELNVFHPKIQCATFHHLELITTMGSSDGMDPTSHCIIHFDLSHPHDSEHDAHPNADHDEHSQDEHRFNISDHRQQGRLIWDPLRFKQRTATPSILRRRTLNHCSPSIWDRIRSAFHCGYRVPYFWNHRILFRCGGYYASNQHQLGHYNEMKNNSLSAYCDAFDLDRKQVGRTYTSHSVVWCSCIFIHFFDPKFDLKFLHSFLC